MWEAVIEKQKEFKFIIIKIILFVIFMYLYTSLDFNNGGYKAMANDYGVYLSVINIVINIFMSLVSAIMISLSYANYKLSGKESNGTVLGALSVLFGTLTYGCTACVIGFFASIGISFSLVALPLAGLPYKFVSILLVIAGFLWIKHDIKKSKCKI